MRKKQVWGKYYVTWKKNVFSFQLYPTQQEEEDALDEVYAQNFNSYHECKNIKRPLASIA